MEKQFKEGYRYLVKDKDSSYYTILELTVLEVSNKAIKVKFENGNTTWYLKDHLLSLLIEELPSTKQIIKDRLHEIQFHDELLYEKDEPQFTLKLTEENDGEIILKAEEKPKLQWEENSSKKLMTWDEAMEYAKSLGDGWRLPTRAELVDAYDNKVEGFHPDYHWSSITYSRNTNNAWCVNSYDGHVSNGSKIDGCYVCCVREIK